MDVALNIYRAGGVHKLTVIARPQRAALLGEYVLLEAVRLEGLPREPSALDVLRAAYVRITEELSERELGG